MKPTTWLLENAELVGRLERKIAELQAKADDHIARTGKIDLRNEFQLSTLIVELNDLGGPKTY